MSESNYPVLISLDIYDTSVQLPHSLQSPEQLFPKLLSNETHSRARFTAIESGGAFRDAIRFAPKNWAQSLKSEQRNTITTVKNFVF